MMQTIAIVLVALSAFAGQLHAAMPEPDTNGFAITLTEGFQQVLAHHGELLRLRADLERAAGTKLEFHSRDLPFVGGWGSGGIQGGDLYSHTRPFFYVTAQFSAPLFNMGMAANWRRGELEVLAAKQKLNVAVAEQLHGFRLHYLRAQELQQSIAVYEELDRRLQANVTAEQQRRDAGTAGPRPVLQAKVQLLSEQAELTAARREDYDVRTLLAEMMGTPLAKLPRPVGPLAREKVSVDVKAMTELALQQRPDLKMLRTLIKIASEDRRIVQAGYFPSVSVIGSGVYVPGKRQVYQATPIIEGQQPLGTDVRGGVSLTWQIVDNGQVTGASRELEAVRQQYEITLRQLEQNIPRELEQVSHLLENANAKIVALEKSSAEAEENLRLIEQRISLGEATQLDFSDAQRNLLAVRQGILGAQYQHIIAEAELDRITGRYLEFAEPAKSR